MRNLQQQILDKLYSAEPIYKPIKLTKQDLKIMNKWEKQQTKIRDIKAEVGDYS